MTEKKMKSYRKKPLMIEAIQLTKDNLQEVTEWLGSKSLRYFEIYEEKIHITFFSLEGLTKATEGDYIIKGIKGEFYPCREDIFLETYEEEKE